MDGLYPVIYLRGPSYKIMIIVIVTVFLLALRADGNLQFGYSGTVCLTPGYFLAIKMLIFIGKINVRHGQQLRQNMDESAYAQLAPRTLEEEKALNVTLMFKYIFGVCPTMILANLKMDFPFPKGHGISWLFVFLPFMIFCAVEAYTGFKMGIEWWYDVREDPEASQALMEQA